jgi:peptidoglycan/xylan/chitin deacetylase (PgdA/CDA1 family)
LVDNTSAIAPTVVADAKTPDAKRPPVTRVSDRPANEAGAVLILEYHHVKSGKGDMFRTPAQFKADLERLYEMGFRPVTVSEYLANDMDLAPGASPVVMTFDDSNPSQFQLKDDGTVDPASAVGIWSEFAQEHPDFPVKGTFYVLPDVMWGQPKHLDKKLELLRGWGSELGSHTTTHPQLRKLTDEQVKKELATSIDALEKLGEKSPVSLALPFGISPKNKDLLKGFSYGGKTYSMKAAMLVGANPAPAPTDEKLNRYRIPRIQAYPGDSGSDYWLKQVAKGNVKVYVAP